MSQQSRDPVRAPFFLKQGVLIAVEGVDGAGKTTQVGLLAGRLRVAGLHVVTTKEPTKGPWGVKIRESATAGRMPPEEELEAFLHDRREHVRTLITPELDRGSIVIVDRYYYSTVAYQGARGMEPQSLIAQNEAFAPRPHLLVIIEVPPEEGVARVRRRDMEENLFEKLEDLRRADTIFKSLQGEHILRLDGCLDRHAITDQVQARVHELVPELSALNGQTIAAVREITHSGMLSGEEADRAVDELVRLFSDRDLANPHG